MGAMAVEATCDGICTILGAVVFPTLSTSWLGSFAASCLMAVFVAFIALRSLVLGSKSFGSVVGMVNVKPMCDAFVCGMLVIRTNYNGVVSLEFVRVNDGTIVLVPS
jgi:hypothetical protein